tara:strand:+ start:115 stop:597 length:483 start_codon:yes stop_codon:yes gene_type:complete
MQLRGTQIVVDTVSAKRPVVSGSGTSSTYILNETQSGSIVLLDKVGGATYTLPTAKPGIVYHFVSSANLTSGSYKITATAATSSYVIVGNLTSQIDSLTSGSMFIAGQNGVITPQSVTLNGASTGGRIGSYITVSALSSSTWHVSGLLVGTTTQSTPFAA